MSGCSRIGATCCSTATGGCSERWPGNTADVTTLIPVIDRLRRRFDITRVCVVADRGMISAETIAELEARRLLYILGVRERTDKLVRELVLDDPAPFVPLVGNTGYRRYLKTISQDHFAIDPDKVQDESEVRVCRSFLLQVVEITEASGEIFRCAFRRDSKKWRHDLIIEPFNVLKVHTNEKFDRACLVTR